MKRNDPILDRKIFKAIAYECNYKDFSKEALADGKRICSWSDSLWSLINAKNTWTSSVLKLDVLLRGKDELGFYQNYVYLLVKKDSPIGWDEYLKSLGYSFTKQEVNVAAYTVEWDEKIDEYLLEVD